MSAPGGDGAGAAGAAGDDRARRQRILEERARAAARIPREDRSEGDRVLAFRVGGERYAVEAAAVSVVLDAAALGPLVGAPPWLLGAALARSRIVPVLDLRPLLGLRGGGMSDLTRIVVVDRDGDVFGLAVEALDGERELVFEAAGAAAFGAFRGIAADGTALLELARLGAPEEA